jgi:AcrR family transcriptional regulator
MANEDRLTRAEWVKAALLALASATPDAMKIERLAKALNVSRGSFYWHFEDVAAFHRAVLEEWERQATAAVIDRVEAAGGGPADKLHRLAQVVFAEDGAIERQVRAWSAKYPLAAEAQDRVDLRRIAFVRAHILSTGVSDDEADARAKFVYLALIGQFTTGRRHALDQADLAKIVDLVIGRKQ